VLPSNLHSRDFTERTDIALDADDLALLKSQRYMSVIASLVNLYGDIYRKATTEIYLYNIFDKDPWDNSVSLSTDNWAEQNVQFHPKERS